jgi:YD repeat-containing protein
VYGTDPLQLIMGVLDEYNTQCAWISSCQSQHTVIDSCTGIQPMGGTVGGGLYDQASDSCSATTYVDGSTCADQSVPHSFTTSWSRVATTDCTRYGNGVYFKTGINACVCQPPMLWVPAVQRCVLPYIIELYHDKSQPHACSKPQEPWAGNPIYPLTGSKRLEVDLGHWFELPVKVRYDTRRKIPSDTPQVTFSAAASPSFGPLWETSLHRRLVQQLVYGRQALQASRGMGAWISFTYQNGVYVPDADVDDRVVATSNGWRYYDAAAQSEELYNSTGFLTQLTTRTGSVFSFLYSDSSTPVSVAPSSGLLIQVQDQNGRYIKFTYESAPQGGAHILTMAAGNGQGANQTTQFGYDANGNLTQVTWPDQSARQFLYEKPALLWALTGVVDENNRRTATYDYDENGYATDTQLAGGVDHFHASWGSPPKWSIVDVYDTNYSIIWRNYYWVSPQNTVLTLPNGQSSNWGATNVLGMNWLSSQDQPAGSGCQASTSSQSLDANGNIAQKDDFDGHRTCYAFDASRNLETTKVEGLSSTAACSSSLPSGSTLPAGARKTSTQWHPDWRLPTTVAEPGRITTYVYNGQFDPFTSAVANCAPSTATLPDGKPLAVLCKKVEQATLDADGSLGNITSGSAGDPYYANVVLLMHMDGSFKDSSGLSRSAKVIGAPQLTTSAKFGVTAGSFSVSTGDTLAFDDTAATQLTGDFTIEAFAYWSQTPSDNAAIITLGNYELYRARSSDGSMLRWYDGAVRIVGTTAITNGVWHHLAVVRKDGVITAYLDGVSQGSYNSTAVIGTGAAGSDTVASWSSREYLGGVLDELRVTKGVARYTGPFTPPTAAFGDSTTPIPASGPTLDTKVANRVWTYTYNAYGQVLTAKGPRTDVDDTTTYTYYSDSTSTHTVGDLQSVKNALGQVTNYTSYDANGNVLEVVDANNVATDYTYDARQRLKTVTTSGQKTQYDYWPTGLLKQVTFPDSSYVSYVYDDAHRLTDVTDSLGNTVHYVLDNLGNRTAEQYKDPNGNLKRELDRVIDALGRVQQTTGRE